MGFGQSMALIYSNSWGVDIKEISLVYWLWVVPLILGVGIKDIKEMAKLICILWRVYIDIVGSGFNSGTWLWKSRCGMVSQGNNVGR